ncbi:MAG: hypothetical protein K0S63_757 [Gammaproteobacteria bacterium]|jgi:WD40 repeat protein|nr:hypothetical protein [Gammaproteobacteria bacterium]
MLKYLLMMLMLTTSFSAVSFATEQKVVNPPLSAKEKATVKLPNTIHFDNLVASIAYSPDESEPKMAIALGNGEIVILDLMTNREERRLRGHTGFVNSIAFNMDGKILPHCKSIV